MSYKRISDRIPLIRKEFDWSIGIYTGESPLRIMPDKSIINPVITAKDVTDVTAEFVADPFMVNEASGWYMYFEVMDYHRHIGKIGLAVSNDGFDWTYKQIVLDEPFHLAYPYIFKWEGEFYIMPDSCQAHCIRLYKAIDFPTKWQFVKILLSGHDYVDSSIFYFNDMWWLLTASAKEHNLYLYYTDNIFNQWIKHPKSPILKNDMVTAVPAGRILIFNNQIIRYAHCDYPAYGNKVYAFKITKLTTAEYEEEKISEAPVLEGSGAGWNCDGMHHIDAYQIGNTNKWIACVDGYRKVSGFNAQKLKLKLTKFFPSN